ncbi:efflux transporter outer membrane subunit [Piscinibacter defluvii]|uniref:efflux transporter outer membrane subunit n=1 Tax=Piscinibacter defluvii TaxID=1796922 RepID=UPI000FDDFEBA|nr:efflux transporter outer membrane subunit [Piscinibacter defluvii]
MRKTALLAVPLAAVLAGCATAPPAPTERRLVAAAELPVLAPAAHARLEAGLAIERWWTLFGDPALDRLIEQALRDSHDLAAAAARVREAQARLDELRGARRPALDLQASHGRARQSAEGTPAGAPRVGGSHRVALVARHEIDLWGRLAAASDAAGAQLRAQQWARASVEWGLSAQLAEVHFGLRALQRQLEIAEAVRAGRATTLALRRREQAAGIANEFDLRRAEAELAGTEATLAALRRQRAALEATLALLAGRPLAQVVDREAPHEALDPGAPFQARLPQGDAAELLLRRPDLRQAEAQLAAAQADVDAARAATLPTLALSGSVGSDVRSLSNLFDGPGMVWSLALSATHHLFDGGQGRSRVAQADARADAALAGYRQAVLAAVLELREAYATLDLSQQALQAEQARTAALARSRRLAGLGYASGAFGYLDLLDAERHHFQAQLDEVDAYRDRLLGQVAAFKALGGGHRGLATAAAAQPESGGTDQ